MALTILGFSLVVIFEGIGMALRQRAQAADYIRLALVEEQLLGRLAVLSPDLEALAEGEQEGISWRLEQAEASPAAGAPPGTGAAAGAAGPASHGAELVEVSITFTMPSGEERVLRTLVEKGPQE